MPTALEIIRSDFTERVRLPRPLMKTFVDAPRLVVALVLAIVPAAVAYAAFFVAPAAYGEAMTSAQNVHQMFARFLTADATASAIAVSVATMTISRELSGVGNLRSHLEDNLEIRRRVRDHMPARIAPVGLSEFLAAALDATAERARKLREQWDDDALARSVMDIPLRDFLDALAARAARVAQRLDAHPGSPDRMLRILLDFEEEMTHTYLRRLLRTAELSDDERGELEELRTLLEELSILVQYAKTQDMQWGLSLMSRTILLGTFPAVVGSALMVLLYGKGAVDAWGEPVAAALVCAMLALALFPLTAFVSYLLRFIVINQNTLPTQGFVLGPEETPVTGRGRDP